MKKYIIPIIVFLLCASKAYAALEITEIMYDPKGPNAGHQWVEVYNSADKGVSIDNTWRFNDGSSHYMNSKKTFDVEPSSYFILTGNKNTFLSDHPSYTGLVIDTSMSIDKDGDTLSLLEDGAVVAGVSFTSSAGASQDDNSLQKINGLWAAAKPTPGAKNIIESAPIETIESPAVPTKNNTTTIPVSTPEPSPVVERPQDPPISSLPAPVSVPIEVVQPAQTQTIPTIPTAPVQSATIPTPTAPIVAVQTAPSGSVSELTPDPPAQKKTVAIKKLKKTIPSLPSASDQTPIDLSTMEADAQAPVVPSDVLIGIGAIVVVVGAIVLVIRRKRQARTFEDDIDLLTE